MAGRLIVIFMGNLDEEEIFVGCVLSTPKSVGGGGGRRTLNFVSCPTSRITLYFKHKWKQIEKKKYADFLRK